MTLSDLIQLFLWVPIASTNCLPQALLQTRLQSRGHVGKPKPKSSMFVAKRKFPYENKPLKCLKSLFTAASVTTASTWYIRSSRDTDRKL
ncbi:uncharacterized protein EV420DRAFT_959160 [Desarmillaria tabescens]|uniref:Secreted protein n=1 Tax=Armillaria tabescens TaxID=1929756 RepID=A0AA39TWM4_ARMTA|nr:uncharacterized protein EV420DRAFT_959160 [Desarmillaria tabescens]KAK0465434.1 hypothetical protein EV420DRAFT_959160 [Desarmillaria tabescens]